MSIANRYRLFYALTWLLLLLPFAVSAAEVVKSANDERSYESLSLANGLQVLLISDPDTDKAAAALNVAIGSASDPADRGGLAHFLEHMLFLGTEKYPEPDAYQSFISAHGGSHNAYTASENTNYFFEVDADFLHEALDRFGQFFIAPLFNEKYVERERSVVHSEYESKKKDDGWRALSARKQALNPAHPYSQFSIGNLETLADRPDRAVRDDLIDFYRRHYSANLMTLVVLGKEPLAELRQWVTEIFAAVPDSDARRLHVAVPLFEEHELPARMNLVPVKDSRSLSLVFPVPPVDEYYRSKPVRYIGHLLGHEGKGSLLSLLKQKGWSEGLSAGLGISEYNATTFTVGIQLTEAGLKHVPEIVADVFRYLQLIREDGVQQWIFDEQRRLAEIDFRFQEKADPVRYVSYLASNLQEYPVADVIRGPYAMDEYKPQLIREYLDYLRPSNVLLMLNAPGLETTASTPWFETPYSIEKLSNTSWMEADATSNVAELALPEPNIFIPEDVTLKALIQLSDQPQRIEQEPGFELWFKQDAEFRVPRADFYFTIRSPLANNSARNAVLTELYVDLVQDLLSEFSYPAYLAGLEYDLYKHIRGVSVRISGYNDKQQQLLQRIAETLAAPKIEAERFERVKNELLRELKNARMDPPYQQAMSELYNVLIQQYWTEQQRITALESIQSIDLYDFIPKLLAKTQLVALSHGNVHQQDSRALAAVLQRFFVQNSEAVDVPPGELLRLSGSQPYIRQLEDIEHNDAALAYYFQGNDKEYATRARFGLAAQILKSPFFQELRTEQRLGYVVYASAMPILEVPGMVFVIQSPSVDAGTLEQRVEAFLQSYDEQLASLDEADFERHKQGLLTRLLEQDKSLKERSDRYWREIDLENADFDTREQLATAVTALTKQEIVDFYRASLTGGDRQRLVVRSLGQGEATAAGDDAEERAALIQNVRSFKRAHDTFPG